MDISIRRLRAEEQATELYQDAYDECVEQQKAEYEEELGPVFCAKHPFKADSNSAHRIAMQRLADMAEEQ